MSVTPDAPILLRVPANHLDQPGSFTERILAMPAVLTGARGRVARGGHLLVTASEVIFEPHSFNLNNERSQLRIPVAEITGARLRTVVITATVVLSTVRGIDLEFVSWSRKKNHCSHSAGTRRAGAPSLAGLNRLGLVHRGVQMLQRHCRPL